MDIRNSLGGISNGVKGDQPSQDEHPGQKMTLTLFSLNPVSRYGAL
jgi:hypothetical protein